jgi:hypothetical protein
MSECHEKDGPIIVHPTATMPNGKTIYSDVSISNMVGAMADAINAGKQLIWQRYQAMLIANSILIGLVSNTRSENSHHVLCVLGLLLCVMWAWLSWLGWKGNTERLRALSRIEWTKTNDALRILNPAHRDFAPVVERGLTRDWIFLGSMGVVAVFGIGYLCIFFGWI